MIPPAHIRAAMQAKYPDADFTDYFAYLEARPALTWKPGGRLHRHHIAPREQFPELNDGMTGANIIVLRLSDHKRAHAILAQAIPAASWPPPNFIAAAARAGRISGRKQAKLGLGAFAPEHRGKAGRKCAKLGLGVFAPEHKGKGGRACAALGAGVHMPGMAAKGGAKAAKLHLGIHARTPRQMSIDGRKAGCTTLAQGKGIFDAPTRERGERLRPERMANAVALYQSGQRNLYDIAEAVYGNRYRDRAVARLLRDAGVL